MASTQQRELEQSKQHRKAATRIKILSRKSEKWVYSLTTVPVPYSEIPVKAQILALSFSAPGSNFVPKSIFLKKGVLRNIVRKEDWKIKFQNFAWPVTVSVGLVLPVLSLINSIMDR